MLDTTMLDIKSLTKHIHLLVPVLVLAGLVMLLGVMPLAAQEDNFLPFDLGAKQGVSQRGTAGEVIYLDNTTSGNITAADLSVKMSEIDETLRLLSRRLEAIPVPGSRPLQADENQQELLSRLAAIELQLQSINQAHLAKENNPSRSNVDEAGVADLRVRLTQIEDILRSLNGQLGDVSFRLTKLSERFEQVAADTEFRFQEIELAARQGRLSDTNDAGMSSEPQVLGTLRVNKSAIISQSFGALGEDVTLVGEAPLETTTISRRNVAIAQEEVPDPREVYDDALANLRKGKIEQAQERLNFFIAHYKKHNLLGNAQYWLGETFYVRRDYKSAAEAFLAGYTEYAASPKAPDSLLKLGMTLVILGEKKTGCDAFAELASRFPNASKSVIRRAEIESQRAGCI